MPKHSKKPSSGKQQRNSGKTYQRNATKAAAAKPTKQQLPTLKTALKHKQTAATLAKTLGCHGINSLLADTAAELQEKGIKQKRSRVEALGNQQEQQQQSAQGQNQPQQQQQLQEQQRLLEQQAQQQQTQVPSQQQPDLMSMLGSWSMQQPDDQQQQQPQAVPS